MDDRLVSTATDASLSRAASIESSDKDSSKSVVEWVTEEDESRRDEGFRLSLSHPKVNTERATIQYVDIH